MKIYRFRYRRRVFTGVLKEEFLFPVIGSVFGDFRIGSSPVPIGDFRIGSSPVPIGDVRILPPVLPTKIVGIGRNYREHAKEMGHPLPEEPLIFLKPPTAVVGHLDAVVQPPVSRRVDYEGEVGVVIRRKARQLGENDPIDDVILGYTCFNDVTARDLQGRDVQFTRAKGFDTFAAVGPCVATGLDPAAIRLKTFLNGKLVQSGTTASLIFPIPYLVRYVSRIMTLNPGDIIATGTPDGVGATAPGDRVDVQVEGVGVLSNTFTRPGGKEAS